MYVGMDAEGSIAGLEKLLAEATVNPQVGGLVVLTCDANAFTPERLDPLLAAAAVPLIGGVFPAIMHNGKRYEQGTVVWGVGNRMRVAEIPGLSDPEMDFEKTLDEAFPPSEGESTQLVFVDGFARRISDFIDALFNVFGLEANTIGGGAGSLSMVQKPCLLTRSGMIMDAAVVAAFDVHSGVGVSHGWTPIGGPFQVTKAEHNVIVSLDWRPAFEVYREVVEAHAHAQFEQEGFFELAKAYPFGIAKMDAEHVVRDPFQVGENGSLVCVGEVPEGSHVSILNGNRDSLLAAAVAARALSEQRLGVDTPARLRLFMDCISRVLFLEEDFEQEIAAVALPDRPLIGACTIGEIASNGIDYLEFYNKTSVVASIAER